MNHYLKAFIAVTSTAFILWGCASTHQGQSQVISANRDAIVADIYKLGADAYQFKIRPASMGGGNGAYDGSSAGGGPYTLKFDGPWGVSNPNATYMISSQSANSITFTAASKIVSSSTAAVTFDADGKAATPAFSGQFK